jgi:hypothetical protein
VLTVYVYCSKSLTYIFQEGDVYFGLLLKFLQKLVRIDTAQYILVLFDDSLLGSVLHIVRDDILD